MSKAAVDANRIKELEEAISELTVTVQAQADEIVSQLNTNLTLRREITILRAQANGQKVEATT